MKKLQVCGLALVAACALSSLVTSSAMAATLLAEWLINGVGVTTTVGWLDPGEWRFGETGVFKVQCSLRERGTLKPDGAGEYTKVFTSAEVEVTSTAPALCKSVAVCEENATDIEVYPVNLPWKLVAFLGEGGEFKELIEGETWHVACLVVGLLMSLECNFPKGGEVELLNVVGGVEVMGTVKPFGLCAGASEEKFESEQLPGSGDESATGTLTVSSE